MAKKVALMCGHGTQANGKWDAGCAYGKYTEAGLMLPITRSAVKYLRKSGVTVVTDADKGNNMNIITGVAKANKEHCDIFISIHCDYSKAPSGVMPLYVSEKGKKLAKVLNTTISKGMPMKSRGVCRRTDLYELNKTSMPAVILETGAIKADLKVLKNNYDKYGKLIAKAVCSYLGVTAKAPVVAAKASAKTYTPKAPYTGGLPSKTIKKGSKGADVKHLQNFLNWCMNAKLAKDGYAGKHTISALKKWQKAQDIKVDGVFASQSKKKAQEIIKRYSPKVSKPATTKPVKKPVSKAQMIVAKAKEYAYPYGADPKKWSWKTGSAKPAYKVALKKYCGKSARVSQTDCGYFASTCVMGAGLAKPRSFNCLDFKAPPSTMKIVHKGKKIPDGFLKAGDVIRYKKKSGQHAMVYMGDGKIAEAQRPSAKVGKSFPAIKKDTKKYNKSNVRYSTIQVLRAK